MSSGLYKSILSSVSRGQLTVKDIANNLSEESSKIAKYIGIMEQEKIVEKRTSYNTERKTSYSICLPILSFWYRFIYKKEDLVGLGQGKALYLAEKTNIKLFLSKGFEDVCLLYINQMNEQGALGQFYPPIRNLRIDNSTLGRSIEIDGLSAKNDSLLVMESKFRNRKMNLGDLSDMKEDVSIETFSTFHKKEFWLFSMKGFETDLTEKAGPNVHLIDLKTMFANK